MQSKAATVDEYLASLPEDRRAAIEAVRAVIRQNLDPGYEEGMQYGMIGYYVPHRVYPAGYHCDPKQPLPFAGLASQKGHMSVYLMCVYGAAEHGTRFRDEWAKTGKKLDMGKSCIRFKKIEDLALDVIGATIKRVPARSYIGYYESAIRPPSRAAAGARKTSAASAGPKKKPGTRTKTRTKTKAGTMG